MFLYNEKHKTDLLRSLKENLFMFIIPLGLTLQDEYPAILTFVKHNGWRISYFVFLGESWNRNWIYLPTLEPLICLPEYHKKWNAGFLLGLRIISL